MKKRTHRAPTVAEVREQFAAADEGRTMRAPVGAFADRVAPELRDETGTVGVTISLRQGGKHAKGNRSRFFTVPASKVSEVAAVIERALFGDRQADK